jgi:hypothetical protein
LNITELVSIFSGIKNKFDIKDVNKLDKPEELTNFINNLKLNEEDLLIRFTIDKNGLVSNPIILLEL